MFYPIFKTHIAEFLAKNFAKTNRTWRSVGLQVRARVLLFLRWRHASTSVIHNSDEALTPRTPKWRHQEWWRQDRDNKTKHARVFYFHHKLRMNLLHAFCIL